MCSSVWPYKQSTFGPLKRLQSDYQLLKKLQEAIIFIRGIRYDGLHLVRRPLADLFCQRLITMTSVQQFMEHELAGETHDIVKNSKEEP
jgi:hypothetical protein